MKDRLSKAPFVLLGVLTILTVAGPLVISQTIRGGNRAGWPPDRALEWWTFGTVIGAYLIILAVCLAHGVAGWRRTVAIGKAQHRREP